MRYIKSENKKQLEELKIQDKQNKNIYNQINKVENIDINSLSVEEINNILSVIYSEIKSLTLKQPILINICKNEIRLEDDYNKINQHFNTSKHNHIIYKMDTYKSAYNKQIEYKNILCYYKETWIKFNKKKYEILDNQNIAFKSDNKLKYFTKRLADKQIEEIMVLDYNNLIEFNSYNDISKISDKSEALNKGHCITTNTNNYINTDYLINHEKLIKNVVEEYAIYYKELEDTNNLQKLNISKPTTNTTLKDNENER